MTKHTIHLKYPFEHEGENITSLTFRRPKGGDIRRNSKGGGSDLDMSFKLMADLAEVTIELIDAVDPVDLDQINDWLEPILDPKARQAASKA